MSEHRISLDWQRRSPDFAYKTYNREHSIRFKNSVTLDVSAAPAFLGKPEFIDPEEMLVASYSSCHMLSFLAIAAWEHFVVDSYTDSAVGHLRKNADGKLAITHIELFPVVRFSGVAPSSEELARLHARSHDECFIANSCKIETQVHPQT